MIECGGRQYGPQVGGSRRTPDPEEAYPAVDRTIHRPNGFLAAIGVHRCRHDGEQWPCMGHRAQLCDHRDIDREKAVIEWQRREIRRQDQLRQAGWTR